MIIKPFSAAVLAAAIAFGPGGRAAADTGDFVAGAIIGGIVGHAATKEAQRRKSQRTYRSGVPSTQQGREIQTSLNYFGFNAGVVDGQLGRRSRNAISGYQAYMGYPVTGRLTDYEYQFLVGSYDRAQASGYAAQQMAAALPDGTRGLLHQYRDEMAGGTQAETQPGGTAGPATETQPAGTLPSFMGEANQPSLASHCNKISLLTNTNGGFTTAETMTDVNFALNEQFCLARTYAIAQSESLIAKVQGFTAQQVEAQCEQMGPALKDYVAALSLKPQDEVVKDVTAFVLKTGMSPGQLSGTARICLGVGYRKDDMDVALGSALLLYALGEGVYGELIGHHLSQGFGTAQRPDISQVWYQKALDAIDAGAQPVFAPGQPERIQLLRKASMQLSAGAGSGSGAATQPAATLPAFSVSE